jgi:hypothetical protein
MSSFLERTNLCPECKIYAKEEHYDKCISCRELDLEAKVAELEAQRDMLNSILIGDGPLVHRVAEAISKIGEWKEKGS